MTIRAPIAFLNWAFLLKLALPAILLALFWKAYEEIPILAIIQGLVQGGKNLFRPTNLKSLCFSALTIKCAMLALLPLVSPTDVWRVMFGLGVDEFGSFISRLVGLGFASLAVGAFTLKDGADR